MRISDWSSDVCSSDLIFYSSRRRKNYAAPGIGGVFYESRPKSSSGLVLLGDGCRDYIRSEEHTSELQSLMRISYAVFCLKKTNLVDNGGNHLVLSIFGQSVSRNDPHAAILWIIG